LWDTRYLSLTIYQKQLEENDTSSSKQQKKVVTSWECSTIVTYGNDLIELFIVTSVVFIFQRTQHYIYEQHRETRESVLTEEKKRRVGEKSNRERGEYVLYLLIN
jgi:hypothetical protein